jgi:hypothetical protein
MIEHPISKFSDKKYNPLWSYLTISLSLFFIFKKKKKRKLSVEELNSLIDEVIEDDKKGKRIPKSKKVIDDQKSLNIYKITRIDDEDYATLETMTLRKLKWLVKHNEAWELTGNFRYKNYISLYLYPKEFDVDQVIHYAFKEKDLEKLGLNVDDLGDYLLE